MSASKVRQRLDQALVSRGLITTRSQAESYIKLGYVKVDGQLVTKPGALVRENQKISLTAKEQYVSRAALKLASVAKSLGLDFHDKVILDVGSSTGGFTDYALQHGAAKVIAVEAGTNQLHPSLKNHPKIELHEKTDIRDFVVKTVKSSFHTDLVLVDVSFISLKEILPAISQLLPPNSQGVAMVKPQFEANSQNLKHKGVIKNDRLRRDILKSFETWLAEHGFIVKNKADSEVAGEKGNKERFYLLAKGK